MRLTRIIGAAAIFAVGLAAATAVALGAPSGAHVKLRTTALGRVLVDAHGRTLYLWAHDKTAKSTCAGECAGAWPPLITKSGPTAGRGVRRGLLGSSRRSDGRRQVSYRGHPLYTFIGDTKPGQTKGEGLTGFGGRWDPVSATGAAVRRASARAAQARGQHRRPVRLTVITPGRGDLAGADGAFNIDLSLQATNRRGNRLLSPANGYMPFLNSPDMPTFGPGKKDPGAPGLVVTLSTTPPAAGGRAANLAGVFQLNAVNRHHGLTQTFNDWQVSSPGFFGKGTAATLTAYLVRGTAPGVAPAQPVNPISNVIHQTFTIAG
jgi:predicted lipoprotein with Yx(FWY)xxD motif